MKSVKYFRKPLFNDPVMVAGWPGMGNVALGVVDYMRKSLKVAKLCEVRSDRGGSYESVAVDEGLARFPAPPKTTLFFTTSPEIIIVEGEAQLSGDESKELMETVVEIAAQCKVRKIFTGAAFPMPMSHSDPSELFGASNTKTVFPGLAKLGIKMMDGGHISGLNGLLLGFAAKRKIDAVCLLATMPQYAIGFNNPKASRAVLEALGKMHNWTIDFDELEEYERDIDEKMALIEGRVKEVFSAEKTDELEQRADQGARKIPSNIIKKIERLFKEAKRDKKNAYLLKNELDRWDLFKVFEDRFLDLFKESQ
ncbi:MAG: PAC2 family protein [Candidatus Omnitrophota bacterium]